MNTLSNHPETFIQEHQSINFSKTFIVMGFSLCFLEMAFQLVSTRQDKSSLPQDLYVKLTTLFAYDVVWSSGNVITKPSTG